MDILRDENKDKNNKLISFCIDDEKLLEKKCVKSVNYPLLFMTF